MKTENQTTIAKQEYQAPELSELGVLSDLTLASNTNTNDGGAQSVN